MYNRFKTIFYSLDEEWEIYEGKSAKVLQRVCILVGLAFECGSLYQVVQWVVEGGVVEGRGGAGSVSMWRERAGKIKSSVHRWRNRPPLLVSCNIFFYGSNKFILAYNSWVFKAIRSFLSPNKISVLLQKLSLVITTGLDILYIQNTIRTKYVLLHICVHKVPHPHFWLKIK